MTKFQFKRECFRYEEEIRAILRIPKEPLPNCKRFTVKYRNSYGYIVLYIEFTIWKEAVRQITIAPLLRDDLAKKNIKEMVQNRGYNHTRVGYSDVPVRF